MKTKKIERPLILFKYGGNAMVNSSLEEDVLQKITMLKDEGYDIVLVHGGGPFIKDILDKVKLESEFIGGHRKTTSEAMEYIEMALKGKVNSKLVNRINGFGRKAVGLSGIDGQSVMAEKRLHKQIVNDEILETDLGQVGNVIKVDPSLIRILLDNGYIPVLSCLAADEQGLRYNINADMFAGHVAGALKVNEFVVLTDVDGLLKDKDDPDSLINELHVKKIQSYIEEGVIQGGMIPKIESCEVALTGGAHSA
ncbi:MAG: acetylglutamate kinase, partial [Bacteroidota bacterium]